MAQISAKMVDQLILEGEAKDIADIVKSAYFRISIKRYVDLVLQSSIIFQRDLSYLTLKKILSVLGGKLAERGVDFVIEPSVTEYIAHREMYLDTRYKLGTEIKKRDSKLQEGFCSFCAVVNSNMTRQLRERQLWDAFFMATMKKSSNFSVPGSGKTSSQNFLYIAAGESPDWCMDTGNYDLQLFYQACGNICCCLTVYERAGMIAVSAEHQVINHIKGSNKSHAKAVFWNEGQRDINAILLKFSRCMTDQFFVTAFRTMEDNGGAGLCGIESGECFAQFLLAASGNAGDSKNLAAHCIKGDIADGGNVVLTQAGQVADT